MRKKIESLTVEQKARTSEFVEKWLQIGLNTRPADRPMAEEGIREAYVIAGLAAPEKIIWCTSPIVALLVIAALKKLDMATVRATVGDTVGDTVRDTWRSDTILWGQQEAAWLSFYDFMREILALKTETDPLNGLIKIAKSANWWWAYKNIVFVCDRPKVVSLDDRKRLHREDGPAVEYRDGWGCYVWHGVRVPANVIEHPELITIAQIEAEDNAEVRRVMTERYGEERYLLNCGAKIVDSDPSFGVLYRKDFDDDESLVGLWVENSTPEPDGTRHKFMIGIQSSAYDGDAGRYAQAASASTWRNADGSLLIADYRTYEPIFES